jgi:hypothetical protein
MYLARREPLGPHTGAIKHILRTRGDGQFFDASRFALWRLAYHRLQTRQIMLHEQPDSAQIEWISKLNMDEPDLHMLSDILQMSIFSTEVERLQKISNDIGVELAETLDQARQLVLAIQDLITSIDQWTSEINKEWKPQAHDNHLIPQAWEIDEASETTLPRFPCPRFSSYCNIWMAYMRSFHYASQIILRESLIELINLNAILRGEGDPTVEEMQSIENQKHEVDVLSTSIIRSYPELLGIANRHGLRPLPQGKMVGRFFSLFSMWVVQKARFTSHQHKQTASEVTSWISFRHGLC